MVEAVAGDPSTPVAAKVGTKRVRDEIKAVTPGDIALPPSICPASSSRWLRVLYLFAGARRKSGLAVSLRAACKGTGLKVDAAEVDVLCGGRRHLLSRGRQNKVLAKIEQGGYQLVAASPLCGTFSRARSANARGPRPLRSTKTSSGLPVAPRCSVAAGSRR